MKFILLTFITLYQKVVSPLLHQLLGQRTLCRYSTSCSTYAKEVIEKHGAYRGGLMAFNRLLHCQPYTRTHANI